ncbi:IclR family transcriptional regulator [Auraticoccus monumenti]|uniref:DNA-binding transcriptional regulator, IclR family n=1 Tax=Auraticoccus monumenti TaxID=675864 RepID=A0A1G6TIQ1_9ACTN|nr:IclR family transcriptional regulator [Auraticoccus monumenti]SDD28205.1 DNA-binding transcriptional regulator, IclR family [Auraticoccus monumenti]
MSSEASTASAGTLARGLDILEWVASVERGAMADLCAALGLSRSAAYRIVGQLRERGYLTEAGENHLRLGPRAIRLGLQALEGLDLFKVTPDHLRALVGTTEETAFVAVCEGVEMAYVMQEVGPQVVKVSSKLGSRAPLHASGLGKAYLSALPVPEAEEIVSGLDLVEYTPTTLTTVPRLLAAVREAAERGYAVDDSEREPGVRCLAAPVLDASRRPVAAISVAGPRDRILDAEAAIVEAVLATARTISTQLGCPDPRPRPQE